MCRNHRCGGEPQCTSSSSAQHHLLQPVVLDGRICHAPPINAWVGGMALLDQPSLLQHIWLGGNPAGRCATSPFPYSLHRPYPMQQTVSRNLQSLLQVFSAAFRTKPCTSDVGCVAWENTTWHERQNLELIIAKGYTVQFWHKAYPIDESSLQDAHGLTIIKCDLILSNLGSSCY